MKKIKFLALFAFSFIFLSSDLPSYKIFNGDGTETSFSDMVDAAASADVVLFGELHNNAVSHWLQLELTKAIYEKNQNLVVGAEMFEADDQIKIDEYFAGFISQSNFEKETKLWDNYKTDYKPVLEFAKTNKLNFVATNIPRRYASLVSKNGLDTLNELSKTAKKYIAPLPIEFDPELPGYKSMSGMAMHGMKYMAEAQASKDATMAHFIVENQPKGSVFLHLNGAYHSNNYEGINWYLKKYKSKIKIVTISTVESDNVSKLSDEDLKIADFIINVDADFTKTY